MRSHCAISDCTYQHVGCRVTTMRHLLSIIILVTTRAKYLQQQDWRQWNIAHIATAQSSEEQHVHSIDSGWWDCNRWGSIVLLSTALTTNRSMEYLLISWPCTHPCRQHTKGDWRVCQEEHTENTRAVQITTIRWSTNCEAIKEWLHAVCGGGRKGAHTVSEK